MGDEQVELLFGEMGGTIGLAQVDVRQKSSNLLLELMPTFFDEIAVPEQTQRLVKIQDQVSVLATVARTLTWFGQPFLLSELMQDFFARALNSV